MPFLPPPNIAGHLVCRIKALLLYEALGEAPIAASWSPVAGDVVHVFTHFRLVLQVVRGRADAGSRVGDWAAPGDFGDYALPTAMKKVVQLVSESAV